MRYLIVFILIVNTCFAQTGEVFIGKKRPLVQTMLRQLEIDEYEVDHIGFKQGEDIWLYLFFDNSSVCVRHYWLVYAEKKDQILAEFDSLGWQRKSDVMLVKENYTCKVQRINEGKNLIFLVEQSSEPVAVVEKAAKPDEKKEEAAKKKAEPKPVASKPKPKPKKKIDTEPEFQGLKILGWEVIKLKKGED